MGDAVFSLKGIKKNYGSHQVLKSVDMQVNKGDIYGLVGKNGAGKTTLFKVILGLSDYQGGKLSILGAKNAHQNALNRRKIGFFVGHNFFDYLSGYENLNYYRRLKGIRGRKEVNRVLEMVGLSQKAAKMEARAYSLGMKQRLGIANALLGDPEVLILDEPTNGLDPQGIADVRNMITRLNQENGTTVLISSHILGELEHTAHRFGIVNEGILMKELSSADLQFKTDYTSIEISDEDVEKAKLLLEQNSINIHNVSKAATTLEDFYFEMIGGEKNG